jgi:hypothetical protein
MSDRERHAFHEAGHAVACTVLGLKVHRASASDDGGRCSHEPSPNDLTRAVVIWAGACAETLTGVGMRPQDWLRQPDAQELWGLPAHIVNRGSEEATRLVSEHEHEVRAVAEHLMASGHLRGRQVRKIIENPDVRPRRDEGVPVSESFA